MIDLTTLHQQVQDCRTLRQSVDALIAGLLEMLDKHVAEDVAFGLRELTTHPDDVNRQIAWSALLTEALTRNTSHVAVDPRHKGYAYAHRMLTETPELDKSAHMAMLEEQLAEHKQVIEIRGATIDLLERQASDNGAEHERSLSDVLAKLDAEKATHASQAAKAQQALHTLTEEEARKSSALRAELKAERAAHAITKARLEEKAPRAEVES